MYINTDKNTAISGTSTFGKDMRRKVFTIVLVVVARSSICCEFSIFWGISGRGKIGENKLKIIIEI
jgi:hypothetical protein